jgi:hypothetical protein
VEQKMTKRFLGSAVLVLLLGGCVGPIHTVVRDPKTGQTEACDVKFYVMTMTMKGRCIDGTSMEAEQGAVVARDRFGAVVTCGPNFNGAPCWPSAQHYKPPAPLWE